MAPDIWADCTVPNVVEVSTPSPEYRSPLVLRDRRFLQPASRARRIRKERANARAVTSGGLLVSNHDVRISMPAPLNALSIALTVVCGCGGTSQAGPAPVTPDPLSGFALSGDPAASAGAAWTYVAQVSGISYDLRGVLLRPSGPGPFPAVIISHGAGGSSDGYSRTIAREMVGWGLVCIATNYTHAGGVPIGS